MRIETWRAIVIYISMIIMLAFYDSSWKQIFTDPNKHRGADFIAFYSAGRVAQAHGYAAIYDINLQQKIESEVLGKTTDKILLYNHMPYFVPILAALVDDNYLASFARWSLVLVSVYLVAIWYLIRSLYGHETISTRLMLAGGTFTFMPLFISLWQGQDTAFLFLGLVLWSAGMLKKNDWLAAGGLTLVTVRPHLCIALVLPLFFKHRDVLWRFVVLAMFAGIYSLLLVGINGMTGFLNLLKISAQGEWFGMNPQNMPNLTGLVYRSLPASDHAVLSSISWIIFAIGLVLVIIYWIRAKTIQEPLLGLTILIAALFTPHLHVHDLTILILPLLFAIRNHESENLQMQKIIILPATSFVFLIGLLINPLYFIVPYVVTFALAWRLALKLPANNSLVKS